MPPKPEPQQWIHVRNWDRFQHYKRRGVPWIKDYAAQLHDEDYMSLSLAQCGLLHRIRLEYASTHPQGILKTLSRHLLSPNKGDSRHFQDNLEALSDAGFIVLSASKTLD